MPNVLENREGTDMSDCKTFNGVSMNLFDCIKKSSATEHDTVYDPPNASQGTATTKTPVGTVVVSFDLNATNGALEYCIVKKPFLAPASAIWEGITDTINACRKSD
jgi:hypothetical protein